MRATAPYRFVALNDVVVPTPLQEGELAHAHDRPLAGGVSATIEVEWVAETPLLIGQDEGRRETSGKGEPDTVGPMMLAGRYVIPGSSLRGMVRSVMEILAFARLRQLNAHHRYGIRDFAPRGYYHSLMLGSSADVAIGAGWLRRDPSTKEVTIQPCRWKRIAIAEIRGGIGIAQWRTRELAQKYDLLNRGVVGPGASPLAWNAATARRFDDAAEHDGLSLVSAGPIEGHLVVSGRATSANANKHYEYVFFDAQPERYRIHPAIFDNFELIHSKPARNAREPEGSWAVLKPLVDRGEVIPVFYHRFNAGALEYHRANARALEQAGDLHMTRDGAVRTLQIGLTRLFKLPAQLSVGDVLRRTACHRFGPGEPLDMVDALFGFVDEVGDRWPAEPEDRDPRRHEPSPARALRSRIAFAMAELVNPGDAVLTEPQSAIMMGPRASFAPFYLFGARLDYSSRASGGGEPYLAGRKRYPVRFPLDQGGLPADRLAAALRATLTDPAGNPLSEATRTRLRLLCARDGAELRFRGRIRLHNIHPAELGAVLWSIMLLDLDRPTEKPSRHSIGRARPFGCGQLRVDALLIRAKPNDTAAAAHLQTGGQAGWTPQGGDSHDPFPFLAAFLTYMDQQLKRLTQAKQPWRERVEVRQLLRTASPEHNWRLRHEATGIDPFAYLCRDANGHPAPGHKAHAAFKRWSQAEEAARPGGFFRHLMTDR